ncbi:MAG: hypothetical protein E2P02_03955 [Acidobacteria bacterium]|nr:MAG: hypothetical protein E2P02_03955 [Acidobacteriota bacterium]
MSPFLKAVRADMDELLTADEAGYTGYRLLPEGRDPTTRPRGRLSQGATRWTMRLVIIGAHQLKDAGGIPG